MPYHNSCAQCGTYKSKNHLSVCQYCGGAVVSWQPKTIRAKRIIAKDGVCEMVSINDDKAGFIVDLEVVKPGTRTCSYCGKYMQNESERKLEKEMIKNCNMEE